MRLWLPGNSRAVKYETSAVMAEPAVSSLSFYSFWAQRGWCSQGRPSAVQCVATSPWQTPHSRSWGRSVWCGPLTGTWCGTQGPTPVNTSKANYYSVLTQSAVQCAATSPWQTPTQLKLMCLALDDKLFKHSVIWIEFCELEWESDNLQIIKFIT